MESECLMSIFMIERQVVELYGCSAVQCLESVWVTCLCMHFWRVCVSSNTRSPYLIYCITFFYFC